MIIDRFGRETQICKVDEEYFRATVRVVVSDNFLGWVIGLGDRVQIVGPENVVERMRGRVQSLMQTYHVYSDED